MKITKRELLKIIREEKRRLAEQTAGVEDASLSADSFGGGDVEDEMFVDVDDSILNQNTDPGQIPTLEVIPERARLKRNLRRIVNEIASPALPPVADIAGKLVAAGPDATIEYVQQLLAMVSRKSVPADSSSEVVPEPAPLPPEDM
jgi:hypothetical protein